MLVQGAGNWFQYFIWPRTEKLIAAILDMNEIICYNLKIKMRTEKLVKLICIVFGAEEPLFY